MRSRSLVGIAEAVLSPAVVADVLWSTARPGGKQSGPDIQMLLCLSQNVLRVLGRLYPPALWLCSAMVQGSVDALAGFVTFSTGAFALVTGLPRCCFPSIRRRIHATGTRHAYRMRPIRRNTVLRVVSARAAALSLLRRVYQQYRLRAGYDRAAQRRYAVCGSLLAWAVAACRAGYPRFPSIYLGGHAFHDTPTSVSVSMERRNWWILKSMPLRAWEI